MTEQDLEIIRQNILIEKVLFSLSRAYSCIKKNEIAAATHEIENAMMMINRYGASD